MKIERDHPQAFAADASLRPTDQRDRHPEREQVAGTDPLDGAHGYTQCSLGVRSAMLMIVLSKMTASPPVTSTPAVTTAPRSMGEVMGASHIRPSVKKQSCI
ncbi:MAG: hypothetical protein IPL45_11860 [Actinomycetales bacterium]|nr:hypothetical protein [Actinomycetales bacterium]